MVLTVLKVHLAHKVLQVPQAHRVQQVHKVPQVPPVFKVPMVRMVVTGSDQMTSSTWLVTILVINP